jgi:D-psicose/D-tagatose/L-ribulose 3-epimerase
MRGVIKTIATLVLVALALPAMPQQAPASVRVGYCTRLNGLEAAKAAGFDYVELHASEVAALSDADFDAALARAKHIGLATPAANNFVPATIRLTGPDIKPDEQMAHVRKAVSRLSKLGVEVIVFGSGGARRVPDGFAKEEAFKQLVDFGRRAAEEAKAHNVTIAVEPLRKQEGLELVKAINHPNFQLMVDFYHLASEQEDPAIVLRAKDYIKHLHMANPQGRVFPQKWEEFDYAPFFANLRAIGYAKRISVEAGTQDLPGQAPPAIALLRRAFTDKPGL